MCEKTFGWEMYNNIERSLHIVILFFHLNEVQYVSSESLLRRLTITFCLAIKREYAFRIFFPLSFGSVKTD